MALPKAPHIRNAHYHPIQATERWRVLVTAEQAKHQRSADQDAARDRERHNETTYARGELGFS